MHFTTSMILTAMTVPTRALPTVSPSHEIVGLAPIPSDLAPGIHHFALDSEGHANISRIGDLDHSSRNHARDAPLEKRVVTWTGCEGYSFTSQQRSELENAWASLLNWASSKGTGESDWIYGHYFALEESGVFAYLCEWGSGNHATVSEINQAHGILEPACANGPGIFQWNEWKYVMCKQLLMSLRKMC